MHSACLLQPVPRRMQHCCLQTLEPADSGVDGSEYMPAKSNTEKEPSMAWKSLGVQGNHIHMHDQFFNNQSNFGIECVDEDERILNHVFFYVVEFRPDSAIVSYWPRTITLG